MSSTLWMDEVQALKKQLKELVELGQCTLAEGSRFKEESLILVFDIQGWITLSVIISNDSVTVATKEGETIEDLTFNAGFMSKMVDILVALISRSGEKPAISKLLDAYPQERQDFGVFTSIMPDKKAVQCFHLAEQVIVYTLAKAKGNVIEIVFKWPKSKDETRLKVVMQIVEYLLVRSIGKQSMEYRMEELLRFGPRNAFLRTRIYLNVKDKVSAPVFAKPLEQVLVSALAKILSASIDAHILFNSTRK